MTIALTPAEAARLFADIGAHDTPANQRRVLLPACPACAYWSGEITLRADGRRLTFDDCGHVFSLSRKTLLAGLAAQRAA